LNIPAEEVPIEKFHFLTKIHYISPSDNPMWGEHEGMEKVSSHIKFLLFPVDYILFIKCDKVTVNPNPGEARDFKFVTPEEVRELAQKVLV
jgi:isopentenyl-diphosphate delta-isomerase